MNAIYAVAAIGIVLIVVAGIWLYCVRNAKPKVVVQKVRPNWDEIALKQDGAEVKFDPPKVPPQ